MVPCENGDSDELAEAVRKRIGKDINRNQKVVGFTDRLFFCPKAGRASFYPDSRAEKETGDTERPCRRASRGTAAWTGQKCGYSILLSVRRRHRQAEA